MMEEKPGEYAGRYVVGSGDELDDSIVEIQDNPPARQGQTTMAPARTNQLRYAEARGGGKSDRSGRSRRNAAQVEARLTITEPIFTYRVERADVQTGKFTDLADAAINTYLDPSTEPGMTYVYRIAAVDAAGNSGGSASVTTTAVRPGPTLVSGDILSLRRIGPPWAVRTS